MLSQCLGMPRCGYATASVTDETGVSIALSDTVGKAITSGKHMVYQSYSLQQKLEIITYAWEHSETEASQQYGVSRSTIYGLRNIDKRPIEKTQSEKFPT